MKLSPCKVNAVALHVFPDIDCAGSYALALIYGRDTFLGIEKARLKFMDTGVTDENGDNGDVLLKERGILCLDVAGGMFDHHQHAVNVGHDRCATSKMAHALGIEKNPELERILKFIQRSDTQANVQVWELPALMMTLNKAHPDNPALVLRIGVLAIKAKIKEEMTKVEALKILETGTWEDIDINGSERTCRLFYLETDNTEVNKVATQRGAQVCIIKRSTGHVQIFTNRNVTKITLRKLAAAIRLEEATYTDADLEGDLETFGLHDQIPEWFFHATDSTNSGVMTETGMLLNGSLKNSNVPVTNIEFKRIIELTKEHIHVENVIPLATT